VKEPRFIVEIVSPGDGEVRDRAKVSLYQAIPSVQVIILVFSRQMRCEIWRRGTHGWAAASEVISGNDAVLSIPEIDFVMSLTEVYEGAQIGRNH
jgi:Uma2 family endonuclease